MGLWHSIKINLTGDWRGPGCSVTYHTKYTCLPRQRVTGQRETAGLGKAFRGRVNREPFFAYLSRSRFGGWFQNMLSDHQHSQLFLGAWLLQREEESDWLPGAYFRKARHLGNQAMKAKSKVCRCAYRYTTVALHKDFSNLNCRI